VRQAQGQRARLEQRVRPEQLVPEQQQQGWAQRRLASA
jgi:hypothetical protein